MATLNLQITATNDDGWCADNGVGTGFYQTNTLINTGQHSGESGAIGIWGRFTGVSGLAGATINSATYKPKYNTKVGTPLTNVYLEKVAAPSAPSSAADYSGKTRTTAFTAVDNPSDSSGARMAIDVTAQLQEIINAGLNPSAIQVLWDDDGSAGGFNLIQIYDESNNAADGAELDIDYTPASGAVVARRRRDTN